MVCVCTCTLASDRLVFDARRSLVLTQGQWLFSNSFSSSSNWSGLNVVRFLRNFGWSEPSKLPVSSLPSTSETIQNNFVKMPLQTRSCNFVTNIPKQGKKMPDRRHGEYLDLRSNLGQDTGYPVSRVLGSPYCLQAGAWALLPSVSRQLYFTAFTVYHVPALVSFQAVRS